MMAKKLLPTGWAGKRASLLADGCRLRGRHRLVTDSRPSKLQGKERAVHSEVLLSSVSSKPDNKQP